MATNYIHIIINRNTTTDKVHSFPNGNLANGNKVNIKAQINAGNMGHKLFGTLYL